MITPTSQCPWKNLISTSSQKVVKNNFKSNNFEKYILTWQFMLVALKSKKNQEYLTNTISQLKELSKAREVLRKNITSIHIFFR